MHRFTKQFTPKHTLQLTHTDTEATEMKNPQQKQHFNHHHALIPLVLDEGEKINCNGCETLIHEPFHGCMPCNYFLHDRCLNTPRFLQHSSHSHPLTLLPTPTYHSRGLICSACGSEGSSFSFSCAQCDFDLHIQCASLPESVLINSEHPHELKLVFGSPCQDENGMFVCDICSNNVNQDEWHYYCHGCDFGAHLGCTMDAKTAGNVGQPMIAKEKKKQNRKGGNKAADYQKSVFEAQRKMKETHIANLAMLQALDNPGDYVGSSHKKYYYY